MAFPQFIKPLSRLFRPAPAAPSGADTVDPGSRAAGPEGRLAGTPAADDEASRAAAVRDMPDCNALRTLAGLIPGASPEDSAGLERAAQQRLARLIDAGTIDFAELSAASGNGTALLGVAGHCADPAHVSRAFEVIGAAQISTLVIKGASSRVRQLAAQRIDDLATLRQLLRQVREQDKNVYKILKQKSDALRAEDLRVARIAGEVAAVCASLERLSHRSYDALYPTSLKLLEEEWHGLEPQAAPEMRERAARAIDGCRQAIAAHARQVDERAAETARQAALRTTRRDAGAQAEAEARQREELAAAAAAEAATLRESQEKIRAERLAEQALMLRQIGGLVGKAQGALKEGNTGRAAGLRRAIAEKLGAAPAIPAQLASQVQHLDAKLNELREWKDYAVAPKRAELIDAMEALIGSSEAPQALADRIKQLQEDWKTISKGIISDSEADWQRFHQAAQTAYVPCREYFDAQAKLRLENVEKRRHVAERLDAFESAQSGDSVDWRAVAQVLREALQEWRRHSPVERAANRAVQERFDAAIGRLQNRLDAWHANNVVQKRSLIERARRLLTQGDGREATDAVKRLQTEWKEVGNAPRDQEQQLWQEFRGHCDAVFHKRQQAQTDHNAALEANKTRAVQLCVEAERISSLSGTELLEGVAKIPAWRAAFENIGEMPRSDQRALRDRFERALSRCRAQLGKQRTQEREQTFVDLLEAARRIHAYGRAAAQGSAAREALKQAAEAFIAGVEKWPKGGADALSAAWANAHAATAAVSEPKIDVRGDAHAGAAQSAPASSSADVDSSLASRGSADSTEDSSAAAKRDPRSAAARESEAQATALRMLCIRSEILTDTATPAEDQGLRREYQVQRLVQHMGRRSDTPDDLDAMVLEWVPIGPVPAATYDSLLARFRRCR